MKIAALAIVLLFGLGCVPASHYRYPGSTWEEFPNSSYPEPEWNPHLECIAWGQDANGNYICMAVG